MRKSLLLIFFLPFFTIGQEYVDVFKISYGRTFHNDFENTESNTEISTLKTGITIPIPIKENQSLVTGVDFSYNNLQLFPEAAYTGLYSTSLTFGIASIWSERWSSTLIFLPKLASDYKNISSDDFYVGGIALLKFKKDENLFYRFGAYASQEAFGIFATPILGCYYISTNKRFEIDLSLPIKGDINYNFGATTLGIDYFGIRRSFNMHYENSPAVYADLSSTEIATYLQFKIHKENILLRTKLGYSINDYEVYARTDKIDLGISAINLGDSRAPLNPSVDGSMFLRFEMVYRFHLGTTTSR